jgi:hypothetical protein
MAIKRQKTRIKGLYVLHSRCPPDQELQEVRQARLIRRLAIFLDFSLW